jgi:hypothetical protein
MDGQPYPAMAVPSIDTASVMTMARWPDDATAYTCTQEQVVLKSYM